MDYNNKESTVIINICHTVNGWTPEGPGVINNTCTVSNVGFTTSGRGNLVQGSWTRDADWDTFLSVLQRCGRAVCRIKDNSSVEEMVTVSGYTNGGTGDYDVFYSLGSYYPRRRKQDIADAKGNGLAAMLITYLEESERAMPASIIKDYIMDNVIKNVEV